MDTRDTSTVPGFRYRAGFNDYICPRGHPPERIVSEQSGDDQEHRYYYPLGVCKECPNRAQCCPGAQKKVLKVRISKKLNARTGVKSPNELFRRFPLAQAVRCFLKFRYNDDELLVATVKGENFIVGESESECLRLWDFIVRARVVFTDGSQKDGHISSSYISFDCFNQADQRTVSVRTNETVLDSELRAAIMAVDDAIKNNVSYLEIRSDNKTVVDLGTGALNPKLRFPYAFELREKIEEACRTGMKVTIAKVQGHSGDVGNDLADYAAGAVRRLHPVLVNQLWDNVDEKQVFFLDTNGFECKQVELTDGVGTSADSDASADTPATPIATPTTMSTGTPTECKKSPEDPKKATKPIQAEQESQPDWADDLTKAPVLVCKKSKKYRLRGSPDWHTVMKSIQGSTPEKKLAFLAQKYMGFASEAEAKTKGFNPSTNGR